MKLVQFWINNNEYNNAIKKLGDKSELYGFAKEIFLKELEEMKMKKREVWYECPKCKKLYHVVVKANIEPVTGRLIPVCDCGRNLVRRVKIIDVKD